MLDKLRRVLKRFSFKGSGAYWENRYRGGGTSGAGSYGKAAIVKAEFLNQFLASQLIDSALEFGCGDGNQLSLIEYPRYIGLDVSKTAIAMCVERFASDPTKSFFLYESDSFFDRAGIFRSDLAVSLDVLFHLVEDDVFESQVRHLFQSATRYVIIYSTNFESSDASAPHVKHRDISGYVAEHYPDWELKTRHPVDADPATGPPKEFLVYERRDRSAD